MAGTTKVNTATLIRGGIHILRHPDATPQAPIDSIRFELNVPVIIKDKHILEHLEEMHDEVTDGDGEVFEKPLFHIQRNVTLDGTVKPKGPTRLKSDRKIKRRRPRKR